MQVKCKQRKGHSQKDRKLVFKIIYHSMQVKSIAECSPWSFLQREHSTILLTFIKLPFMIFVLSIFEWPFYSGFTVHLPYEPVHEISNNVICATSKASDQPAH